ncbi:GNAT family N-acetyltransferase [Pseudomonas sp. NPDC089569]|uniref:GNAT family N-acetyltransferase n=1 Tax=Pseudomonas sp. NPDC089569 TaxID=3390722 RepID=UPI003D0715A7
MEIMHFTDGINPRVLEESLKLAIAEAPAMIGQNIDRESPLLALAEAEVGILLGGSLRMVGAGARQVFNGVMCDLKVGVIAAIDDEGETPRFAGFIQYKPRLLTEGVASIGYAAVVEEYRGKGVFKQMLEELKSKYTVISLDCPLELVPFYEKLGFHADNIQHAHVGMSNGPLSGITWMQDQEYLENQKPYQQAKAAIRDKLGKRTAAAYAKRDADTRKRVEEIEAMLATRGVESAGRTQQPA